MFVMFVACVFLFVLVINVEFYLCEKYLHLCIYISVPAVFLFGHLVRRCDRILSHLAATSGWGNTLCLWVLNPGLIVLGFVRSPSVGCSGQWIIGPNAQFA